MLLLASSALLLFSASVGSALRVSPALPLPPTGRKTGSSPAHLAARDTTPPLNTTYYFDQLIDHNDTSKGTFQQRYQMTWEWYEAGMLRYGCLYYEFLLIVWEGGPIVLFTPGEAAIDGGFTLLRPFAGTSDLILSFLVAVSRPQATTSTSPTKP